LVHGFPDRPTFGKQWIERWVERLRASSIDIHSTEIGLPVPGERLPWTDLDRRWRRGDRELMELYERLGETLTTYDVFINYGGVNLHPEFLSQLSTINVLGFFDDPESSAQFSQPVAAAHDICAVGNVAELGSYRSWGVENVYWWPLGFRFEDFDPTLCVEDVLSKGRVVDVTLLCERMTNFRRTRVDDLLSHFRRECIGGLAGPQGSCRRINACLYSSLRGSA